MARMFYDADANLDLLKGKTVAVMGFVRKAMPRRRTCMKAGSM